MYILIECHVTCFLRLLICFARVGGTRAAVCMWQSGDNLHKLILPLHLVGTGDGMQVASLGIRHLLLNPQG